MRRPWTCSRMASSSSTQGRISASANRAARSFRARELPSTNVWQQSNRPRTSKSPSGFGMPRWSRPARISLCRRNRSTSLQSLWPPTSSTLTVTVKVDVWPSLRSRPRKARVTPTSHGSMSARRPSIQSASLQLSQRPLSAGRAEKQAGQIKSEGSMCTNSRRRSARKVVAPIENAQIYESRTTSTDRKRELIPGGCSRQRHRHRPRLVRGTSKVETLTKDGPGLPAKVDVVKRCRVDSRAHDMESAPRVEAMNGAVMIGVLVEADPAPTLDQVARRDEILRQHTPRTGILARLGRLARHYHAVLESARERASAHHDDPAVVG